MDWYNSEAMDPIDEIKRKIDIVEFIGAYISVKRTGRNFKAVCPFHTEKTPSFVISPERQIWHCFGTCGDGGDIFKFLMKWENITFPEALTELAQKAGVKLQSTHIQDVAWKKRERLFSLNNHAADFFRYIFEKTAIGATARKYVEDRRINDRTAHLFGIGYAPSSWDSLFKYLKKKRFEDAEIIDAGVAIRASQGRIYDRFRGRLIFPIRDPRGGIIGFSGRLLTSEDKEAKYINTPETAIYHKRESLYGIDLARDAIKKNENVYIVEGEFDVISAHQHDINNVVAIKGSALTIEQLQLLKRYCRQVILMLDADAAGDAAVVKGLTAAESLEMEIEVVSLDFAKDPDEAIHTDLGKFKKALAAKVPAYDFLIDHYTKKYPTDDPYDKKKLADAVISHLAIIQNPVIKSHYIKKIADLLNVSEESVQQLMRGVVKRRRDPVPVQKVDDTAADRDRQITLQMYILSLIFQSDTPESLIRDVFEVITPKDFLSPAYRKISEALISYQNLHGENLNIMEFADNLDAQLRPVFDKVYLFASVSENATEHDIHKLVLEIKRYSIKAQMGHLLSAVGDKDPKEEHSKKLKEASARLSEVEKRLGTV